MKHRQAYYIVNAITLYRLLMAPVLILLLFNHHFEIFRWLLAVSFFTDAIDGWLARKLKVSSVLGSRIDSLGDDMTVLAGVVGVMFVDPSFLMSRAIWIVILLILFLGQVSLALKRYGKLTSFHTWLAKTAAVAQGLFFIAFFFMPSFASLLFIVAFSVTLLELIEEIALVLVLSAWRTDVKGIFWVKRSQKRAGDSTMQKEPRL